MKPDADKLDVDKLKNVPTNLSHLKNTIDKLNFDKLAFVLIDLNKPSDVVKNDVVKKDVCNSKIKNIEGKILDIISLATTVALNTKINEIKGKIPSITNLATNYCYCFTAVENKIPHVSNLVKKNDYSTKISEVKNKIFTHHEHNKYITTQELNELWEKVRAILTKRLTIYMITKFSILNGTKYFSSGTFQNYLLFIPAKKFIKNFLHTKSMV